MLTRFQLLKLSRLGAPNKVLSWPSAWSPVRFARQQICVRPRLTATQVHRNVPPVTSAQNSAAVRSFGLV